MKFWQVIILYLFFVLLIGGLCVEYTVETWASYFKETPVDVPFWGCILVAIPLSGVAVPATAITWLIFAVVL